MEELNQDAINNLAQQLVSISKLGTVTSHSESALRYHNPSSAMLTRFFVLCVVCSSTGTVAIVHGAGSFGHFQVELHPIAERRQCHSDHHD